MIGTGPDKPPGNADYLFQARLAEHISARDEMISAISNQHLALTFGTASIVGVFVAGFLTWEQPANPAVFFAIAPLSAWVLAMWLAEVVRMFRPVAFCREQGALLNASIGVDDPDHPPIRWESWRDQDSTRTITWTYISVVAVLAGAYVAGVSLGLVTAHWSLLPSLLVASGFALGLVVVLWAVAKVLVQWSSPMSMVGMPTWVARWAEKLARGGPNTSSEMPGED